MKKYIMVILFFLVITIPTFASSWETIVEIVDKEGSKLVKIDESRINIESERDQKVVSFWLDINMKDSKAELQAEYLYKVYCTDKLAYEIEGTHKYYYHKALISADNDTIPRKLEGKDSEYINHILSLVCEKYN